MSLITRCPACGTMFKVVPDQLRISEGWVRCGHCAEVFDATAGLQGSQAVSQPERIEPEPTVASVVQAPLAAAVPPDPIPAPVAAEVPEPEPELAPVVAAPAPITRFEVDNPDSIAPPPLYPWFPSEVHDSQLERESQFGRNSQFQRELANAEPDLDDVSFVRAARRKALWRRPLVRALLAVLLLALGALLVLQYGVLERDKLAAQQPALRPWLAQLCEPLHCELRPPRQIDAIVIDSSSFTRLRTDVYRLNYALRNQGRLTLEMPAIELTLTDNQDQPLIRRVLMANDVGAPAVISAAAESNGSIAIAVTGNGGRVAGYRLLAFYP
jgi:predicted Zn finger-like uncharacterized protein